MDCLKSCFCYNLFHLRPFWISFWTSKHHLLSSSLPLFHIYTTHISKFSYPKNVPKKPKNMSNFATIFCIQKIEWKYWLYLNFWGQKILRKAQVFSLFFNSWGFTGLHSLLQFITSKNAKETCAFLKIFLSQNFLNKSHIFPPFPRSKNASIITHIFKVFWRIFRIRKFWDVCSV